MWVSSFNVGINGLWQVIVLWFWLTSGAVQGAPLFFEGNNTGQIRISLLAAFNHEFAHLFLLPSPMPIRNLLFVVRPLDIVLDGH